jgi:hypothetical protein
LLDYLVLRLLTRDRVHFEKYFNIISKLILEKEVVLLVKLIGSYYRRFPEHTYISQSEFQGWYDLEYPNAKARGDILRIIENIYTTDTSDSLASDVVHTLIQRDAVNRIVYKTLPFLQGEPAPAISAIKEVSRRITT